MTMTTKVRIPSANCKPSFDLCCLSFVFEIAVFPGVAKRIASFSGVSIAASSFAVLLVHFRCDFVMCCVFSSGACQEAEGDVREAFEVEMPPVDCIVCQMPLEQRADDEADYDSERTDTDNEDIHPECHAACYPLFVWFDELKTPASDIASDIDAKSQQPLQEPVNLGKTTTCTEMMCLPCQPQMKKMKLVHSA